MSDNALASELLLKLQAAETLLESVDSDTDTNDQISDALSESMSLMREAVRIADEGRRSFENFGKYLAVRKAIIVQRRIMVKIRQIEQLVHDRALVA